MRGLMWAIVTLCVGFCGSLAPAQSITYQGRLTNGGSLASGVYDMRFTLYAGPTGGSPISSSVCVDNVDVSEGLFTVSLLIAMPLDVTSTYIGVEVRSDTGLDCASTSGYTALLPRQSVGAAPRAMIATGIGTSSSNRDGALRAVPGERAIDVYDGGFWYRLTATSVPVPPQSHAQFTTPGVFQFVVPVNTYNIWVHIYGGAGGGGDRGAAGSTTLPSECQPSFGTYAAPGGGGSSGSGGFALMDVTPGETLTITVGAGGSPGSGGAGGTGGTSRVRRSNNTVDVAIALGGNGGGRRISVVSMGADTTASGCAGQAEAGSGGAAALPATFPGVALISQAQGYAGSAGLPGLGPSCYDAVPADQFCPGQGGAGGAGISLTFGGTGVSSQGANGGTGAGPTTPAAAGGSGRVYLWWD